MFNIPKTQPVLPPLKEPTKPEPEQQKKLLPNISPSSPKSDSKNAPVGPLPSRDKVGDPDGQ